MPEPETAALRERVSGARLVACALVRTELARAVLRLPGVDRAAARGAVATVLEGIATVPVDDLLLERAADLEPPSLRSLDALHLACALALQGRSQALVVYDRRLGDAAQAAGLRVESPGRVETT